MPPEIYAVIVTAVILVGFLIWFIRGSIKREKLRISKLEKLKTMYKPFEMSRYDEVTTFIQKLESIIAYDVKGILKPEMELIDISVYVYDEKELDSIAEDIAVVATEYGKNHLTLRNKDTLMAVWAQVTAKGD